MYKIIISSFFFFNFSFNYFWVIEMVKKIRAINFINQKQTQVRYHVACILKRFEENILSPEKLFWAMFADRG